MNVVCKHCSKMYTTQGNLNRHLYEKHGLNSEGAAYDINSKSFKCLEGCKISFTYHAELVKHLEDEHDYEVELEEQKFVSMDEFLVWLGELQNLNYVEYIKGSGKALTHEEDSVIYYICNRSGKPRGVSNSNKRMKKTQGSKKINMACTSRIKLVINKTNSSVAMTFWKTHYGHDFEIEHLRLSNEERTKIAQKLALGVSMTKILDTNRKHFDEAKLKRIDLLTRKDLHNIKSSYNIQIEEGVQDNTIEEESDEEHIIQDNTIEEESDEEQIIIMTVEDNEDISEHSNNLSEENDDTIENIDTNENSDTNEHNDTNENYDANENNDTNENYDANENSDTNENNDTNENYDTNENNDTNENYDTNENSDTNENYDTNGDNDSNENREISEHLKILSEYNDTKNMDNLLQNITMLTSKLGKNIEKVQNIEILKHVERTLRTENILVESDLKKQQNIYNKDIEKQLSFHSTKKRKRTIKYLNKPNMKANKKIKTVLLKQSLKYISRTTQNDHSYL